MTKIDEEPKTKEREKKPFTNLNLDNSIIFSLFIQKYFYCAKIQEISIPHILNKNENVLLQSETGTGKTLCFVIPILQTLINYKKQIFKNQIYITSEKSCKEKTECNPDDTHIDDTTKASDFVYDENSINSIYDYFQKCEITKCKSVPFNINVDKFISYNINNNIIQNQDSTTKEGLLTTEKATTPIEEATNLITNVDPEIKQNENEGKSTELKDGESAKCNAQFNISEIVAIQEDIEIFHNANRNKEEKGIDVNTIIITPTRELCIQIYNVINNFIFFIRLYFSNKFNVDLKILDKDNFFINNLLFRGAVKIEDDIKVLENEKKKKNTFQIITATPGKLANLFKEYHNLFNTSKLKYFILDEGDKLLEESYINYVKDVVNNIKSNDYITCICSATCLYEDKICSLFPSGLKKRKPFRIILNPKEGENEQQSDLNVISPSRVYLNDKEQDNEHDNGNITTSFAMSNQIENYYIVLRNIDKFFFLFKFLNTVLNNGETAIVFFPTCFCVDYYFHMFKSIFSIKNLYNNDEENLFKKLIRLNKLYNNICTDDEMLVFSKMICYIQNYIGKNKINFLKIHRKMKDKKRISAYNKITNNKKYAKKKNVIFCTDVMSRGINIDIQWVINYDVPNKNMTYIHRSGRTGRFDKTGKNIIFINKKEKEYLYFLKSKKVSIYNFKKTDMFQNMIKYESTIIKTEQHLNKEALKLANRNSDCISFLEKKQFFTNCDTTNSKSKNKKGNKNKKDIPEDEKEKNETPKRQNIILPNNIITIFLKLIIFYAIENREIFNLSTKAFLSYIEFYKNHQLNFLFPFSKLNISHLCHTFALVKIPKFKEKEKVKNFKSFDINVYDIPYKNIEKEKKRLENKKKKEEEKESILKKEQPLSTEQNKNDKNGKSDKNKKKRKTIVQRKHEKREMDQNEIDSLFFEEKLFKKLKKKKITDEEYDRLLGIDDLDKLFTSNPSKKNTQIVKTTVLQNSNKKKSKKKQKLYNLKVKKVRRNSKRRR